MSWRNLALWPRGLAGQIAAIVILAVIVAQALTGLLAFVMQPRRAPPLAPPFATATRIGVILKALDVATPPERSHLAEAFARDGVAITIGVPDPMPPVPTGREAPPFLHPIMDEFRGPVALRGPPLEPGPGAHPLALIAQLSDGTRVLIDSNLREPGALFIGIGLGPFFFYLPFLAIAIAMLTVWATRRVTAPLRGFADAAERLGNERSAPPLPERGPIELRRAAQTFNKMQEQLKRFVDDRTRMLAAISHDLRTPLTRLRLRVEAVVDDPDEQQKMLQDLQRMDAMIASALSYLRDASRDEPVELIDFASLLQSVCDDFVDTGRDAQYVGLASLPLRCRPGMLGRAVTNLIENAIKFGGAAIVDLACDEHGSAVMHVDDNGPGIPDPEKQRAFDPFYRLDPARNAEIGGVGLGLSIARSIVQIHNGQISLADLKPHGLRVVVSLPARV